MRYVTSGEQLFFEVRDRTLVSMGVGRGNGNEVNELIGEIGGTHEFIDYIRGTLAVHAVRRLLRYWKREQEFVQGEHLYVKRISRFIKDNMFPSLDDAEITKLARLVVAATDASDNRISQAVRKRVLSETKTISCYLCGRSLDVSAPEGHAGFVTLEHVWPCSVGGDSIEENLLPACTKCQETKKDSFSWEWFNIHNLVLPAAPSEEALKSIAQPARIARHYLQALSECSEHPLTLKEAFRRIGPMGDTSVRSMSEGLPVTFFDLRTIEGA